MSKNLKKTLYIGLAALMVGSIGAGANATVNPQSVSAHRIHRYGGYHFAHHYRHHGRRHFTMRRRHHGMRVTSHWNRRWAKFDSTLNGYHSVYSEPAILGGYQTASAHQVRQAVRRGVRFKAYKGEQINHDARYYDVVSSDGSINGWIYAGSVHKIAKKGRTRTRTKVVNHYITPKGLSKANKTALHKVERSADRGELLADLSKVSFGNARESSFDMHHAENFLAGAKRNAKKITNRRARAKANKIVKNFQKYMEKVGNFEVSAESKRQGKRNAAIIHEVKSANALASAAARANSKAKAHAYLNVAYRLLNKAQRDNATLHSQPMIKSNKVLINNARAYFNRIADGLSKSATHSDVIPSKHNIKPKKTTPKEAKKSVEQQTMDNINSLNDAAEKRIGNMEIMLLDPSTQQNQATMAKMMLNASIIRGDKTNIKALIPQLTNIHDIARAKGLVASLNM